ncbi:hypothetical protein HNQ41_000103 [Texcoconibacillus texcoconensis]|uniref:Uncharacterized protein n=1 Tax=Texcoconibacillus texcoconensis TaxID=1095777 RepID=A0A840QKQ9_9BACI|nr:hypothetical protein [Texcoconibacillus texcoconensis]
MMYLLPLLFLNVNPLAWIYERNALFYKEQVLRLIIGAIYTFVVFYIFLIDVTLDAAFAWYAVVVALNFFISSFRKKRTNMELNILSGMGVILILAAGYFTFINPIFTASERNEIPEAEVSQEQLEPINEENIRVVPYEYARYQSEVVFGSLDNYAFYSLGESSIQKIDDELFWVTPIEYSDFFRWIRTDSVPGYIAVSAEDPNDQAELVDDYEMTVVPSAFFGENLKRHVRRSYPEEILIGTSFEPDEDGHPYYVYSYANYQHFRHGAKAEGVIVVDAVTGEMEDYALGEMPAFIDQGIAESISYNYNQWFGWYKNGFLNRFLGREGVHEPRREELIGVFNEDLDMHWFVDHERPTGEGNTMVGFSMINARTGEMTYYEGASGILNGEASRSLVDRTFERENWVGTQPVLYSIYEEYTWVVPVVDRNDNYRKLALVHADSGNVVYGDTRREAFDEYQYMLATDLQSDADIPTDVANEVVETKTVLRVSITEGEDGQVIRLLFEDDDRIFTITSSESTMATFIEPGDQLEINYIDTEEQNISIQEFTNLTLEEQE